MTGAVVALVRVALRAVHGDVTAGLTDVVRVHAVVADDVAVVVAGRVAVAPAPEGFDAVARLLGGGVLAVDGTATHPSTHVDISLITGWHAYCMEHSEIAAFKSNTNKGKEYCQTYLYIYLIYFIYINFLTSDKYKLNDVYKTIVR